MPAGGAEKHWLCASAKPSGVYHSWIPFPLWHTCGERCGLPQILFRPSHLGSLRLGLSPHYGIHMAS